MSAPSPTRLIAMTAVFSARNPWNDMTNSQKGNIFSKFSDFQNTLAHDLRSGSFIGRRAGARVLRRSRR
jgi:hypothetical protein